ncbi:DNA cytosine methyltransferase [Pseudoalteromonas sp. 2CM37A]|uniref:DNA cytosine methyltransferase n=1 Tax=Pseudoalteromonas sp. 2CM37A TaxID=2929853 RepID=UPI0020BE6C56|nr:DNA cytosine methyltransferase [Pseudoalteromonas sp. 2CM37A]MCK8119749.1 DNA cytosine methyltransferase [Pseudoalteromonas sp. 2CM37A]
MTKITVAGLFSGCGGLDFGFSQAGYNIVWANELSEDAAFSYEKLIGHKPVVRDIWDIIDEVPAVDVIVGGPPCQSFSLVGKRIQDDPRGQLVFAYLEVIQKVMPKVFVMENVAGLTASKINGERLPEHLKKQFEELGYKVTIEKLIATDYFVPQKRKRVFLIGHRNENFNVVIPKLKDFAKILNDQRFTKEISVSEALDDLPSPTIKGSKKCIQYKSSPHSSYSDLMRNKAGELVSLQSMPTMSEKDREFVKHIPPGGNYMNIPDSVSTTRILKFKQTGGRTTTYGRLHSEKPAYTINTYFNRPNVGANYHHSEQRLITVREAMRLQSFPDDFTPIYRSQRSLHMQIGNAVPPLMARAVAEAVKGCLK